MIIKQSLRRCGVYPAAPSERQQCEGLLTTTTYFVTYRDMNTNTRKSKAVAAAGRSVLRDTIRQSQGRLLSEEIILE